ncbi:hypothetical protein [Mesorhizobium argentiipisi]|uniref:Uncharacterized protein n=1 Tax=Mesorhizobium argentiipisi TaxID=3015175 RepID=A0ABU8KA33_9HYPH
MKLDTVGPRAEAESRSDAATPQADAPLLSTIRAAGMAALVGVNEVWNYIRFNLNAHGYGSRRVIAEILSRATGFGTA